ncbi:8-oxo-dGTP diphosphatase [bacterium D16-51]|nr:8-oxo-dGTP diphosphatase [bacterium D16-59]RKI58488.1 8-oxo-dGTP diphosphatase [bacterium D16-51]
MKKEHKSNLSTLCYIEQDECYLMMHRISKENDINHGKWIGVGGHFEENESPEDCLLREVKEETGLTLTSYSLRGIITFISDGWGCEYMHLYTADAFDGTLTEKQMNTCNEGILRWVPKKQLMDLELWEGDRVFLGCLLNQNTFFSMKLKYHGDKLVDITTTQY